MPPMELALAVLALLLTPGPTNSLMLLAGAERGLGGAARLIPAELFGYVLTILPLVLIGPAILGQLPGLREVLILAAAAWVGWLAVRLWHFPSQIDTGGAVDGRAMALTTALNPKALIFGLVLLPSPDRLAANLVLFAGLVVCVALLWAAIGAGLRRGGARGPRALFLFRRLASVWLGAISLTLVLRGVGA